MTTTSFKVDRKPISRWLGRAIGSLILLQAIAAGAAERGYTIACLTGASSCATRLAQLASPSGHPSGILGTKDQRVQIPPDQWPWSAIGRINVVAGPSYRGQCTGTLIAPRRVITAAHCLFNSRINDWVKPGSVHFVVGQSGEKFLGHSLAASFETSPQFKFKLEDRPRYDFIAFDMIPFDWAVLTLEDDLNVKPVPVRALGNAELPAPGGEGLIALAGYGADHPYVLSVHKGCTAQIDAPRPGMITHTCDSAPGESGGPILLLSNGDAAVIGIHSANTQHFESQVGYQAMAGRGVAASEFAAAVAEPGH